MIKPYGRNALLLVLGSSLFLLTKGNSVWAPAAWLYPILFLRLSRRESPLYATVLIPLATALGSQASFWRFTYDTPDHILFYIPFLAGLAIGYLFLADRLLMSRFNGPASVLIFPLLYTSFDFFLNLANPFGTLGVLGYSQIGFLAFAQLASVTGMWGLTFMMAWFASASEWAIAHRGERKAVRQAVFPCALAMALIFAYGLVRLSLPSDGHTVRFAGIHVHDRDHEGKELWDYLRRRDKAGFQRLSDAILDRLIAATRIQAAKGAELVVWSELSPTLLQIDGESVSARLAALARELKIYLVATPYLANLRGKPAENSVRIYSPEGKEGRKHVKFGGNFLEGTVEGDRVIRSLETPIGKLAAIVCWDGDFPSVLSQVGRQQVDLLIIPASDWREVTPAHALVTVFRGIENGCSVIRQTQNGLSIATDPAGREVARLNHFETRNWVMPGQVRSSRMFALYPIVGDVVGWLCLFGAAGIAGYGLFGRPKR